jgi:hypothetical protein
MKAIWGIAILTAVLASACSAPPAKPTAAKPTAVLGQATQVSGADALDAAVREKIVPNWYIDYEAAEACPRPFQLQVALKPSGVVQEVVVNREPSNDEACRSLVESARRAVLKSSPLPVPDDVTELTINFDIPAVLEEL